MNRFLHQFVPQSSEITSSGNHLWNDFEAAPLMAVIPFFCFKLYHVYLQSSHFSLVVSSSEQQLIKQNFEESNYEIIHIIPDGCDAEGYHKNKAKRVRTTFTEEQLQVLQANFQLDSNPDGQDLERIAQITGLSKRVTQVWFQNSRARQKKHMHTGKIKTQCKLYMIVSLSGRIKISFILMSWCCEKFIQIRNYWYFTSSKICVVNFQ